MNPQDKEAQFNKKLIAEYLKYGSVDKVFKKHRYSLPISYPSFQRLLDKWGIVKAAGPNSLLSEAVSFIAFYVDRDKKDAVENLYTKMPPSFKTSLTTIHRILGHAKEGVVRRYGTALVLIPADDEKSILFGKDISAPKLGARRKIGEYSLPMTFSKSDENSYDSIVRVLQQEVFTNDFVEQTVDLDFLSDKNKPFMRLHIADVEVSVYSIKLPKNVTKSKKFSSYKLKDHQFFKIKDIKNNGLSKKLRPGVLEIVEGYENSLSNVSKRVINEESVINQQLVSEIPAVETVK